MTDIHRTLGRGNLQSAWVIMRRAVALAELIGLPRAAPEAQRQQDYAFTPDQATHPAPKSQDVKVAVWEAICVTDRNFGMMLNLRPATAGYPLRLTATSASDEGHGILAWHYNYQLSRVCEMIFRIDDSYVLHASEAESYEKVLRADCLLRDIAVGTPREWWDERQGQSVADQLVKFWHHYLTVRTHLRPALTSMKYPYSRLTCREACLEALQRFVDLRSSLPAGFFVCRVVDVQAFTAASYLLLTEKGRPDREPNDPNVPDLIGRGIECWRNVSGQEGSDFAREAIEAIELLRRLALGQQTFFAGRVTLQIHP